ncbi:MAG: endonuclease, partial [Candidatus Rifleibacteriota bacterium]
HREDPVDEEEKARNDRIENIQHNRNPFVDRPDFVDQISDF